MRTPQLSELEFDLAIEPVKVREFAQAVRERHWLHTDPTAAAHAGYPNVVAPLTFTATEQWHVSLNELAQLGAGLDVRHMLHAEQQYTYERLPVAGEVLHCVARVGSTWEKRGRRGGALLFRSFVMSFTDNAGRDVVRSDYTLVEMTSSSARAALAPSNAARTPDPDHRWGPDCVVESLTGVDLARYAGASGDFNPMHVDDAFARASGLPSVFAMGMLPAGLVASSAVRWFGDPRVVRRVRFQFLNRAWPGDRLVSLGWAGDPTHRLEIWRGTAELIEPVVRADFELRSVDRSTAGS